MSNCEYVSSTYNVPACIGRRVTVYGKSGIIAADCGNYIGVNLDTDKPGAIRNYHPTDGVEYGEMGTVRKPTRSQQRYQDYLEVGECFESFLHYLKYESAKRREEKFV